MDKTEKEQMNIEVFNDNNSEESNDPFSQVRNALGLRQTHGFI